jgi:hypothetical protein
MTMRVAIVALSVLAAGPVQAITLSPMTFEQLVGEAAAVVYARVADVRGRWTADRRRIESVVTLDALRYFKGDLGDDVELRVPGGEAGGLLQVLPGAPVLREGDLVVAFLGSRGPAMPTLVGLTQGVFRVVIDARTGTAQVTPPPLKASAAGRIVRGAADRRTLTLDAFAAEVRSVLEARPFDSARGRR